MSSVNNKRIENKNRHRIMYNAHQNVFNELLKHEPFIKGSESILDECLSDFDKIETYLKRLKQIKEKNKEFAREIKRHKKKWMLKNLNTTLQYIDKLNIENLKEACKIYMKVFKLMDKHKVLIKLVDYYHFTNKKMDDIHTLDMHLFKTVTDHLGNFTIYDDFDEYIKDECITRLCGYFCFNMYELNPMKKSKSGNYEYDDDFDKVIDDQYKFCLNNNMYFCKMCDTPLDHSYKIRYDNGLNKLTISDFIHKYVDSEEKS